MFHITVRDTGTGIPADKLDAIFEPFVQVNRDYSSKHQGTGLGLSISRDLARRMDGDLTVTSVYGEGATFVLSLPKAEPKPTAETKTSAERERVSENESPSAPAVSVVTASASENDSVAKNEPVSTNEPISPNEAASANESTSPNESGSTSDGADGQA